jgi:hypothetical protein
MLLIMNINLVGTTMMARSHLLSVIYRFQAGELGFDLSTQIAILLIINLSNSTNSGGLLIFLSRLYACFCITEF